MERADLAGGEVCAVESSEAVRYGVVGKDDGVLYRPGTQGRAQPLMVPMYLI